MASVERQQPGHVRCETVGADDLPQFVAQAAAGGGTAISRIERKRPDNCLTSTIPHATSRNCW
jgi:hypothetical protein